MSARYVWDKYNTKIIYQQSTQMDALYLAQKTLTTVLLCNDYEIYNGGFRAKGSTHTIQEANAAGGGAQSFASTSDYKYAIVTAYFSGDQQFGKSVLAERTKQSYYWHVVEATVFGSKGVNLYQQSDKTSAASKEYFTYYFVAETPGKGDTLQGQASSAARSAYPDDGVSGSNWYVYKGSDNVDPIGVSYNADRAERGKQITASIALPGESFVWATGESPLHEGRYFDSGPCVAYGGGKYVSIPETYYEDETPGTAAHSADGANWSGSTIPVSGTFGYNQVAYGNNKLLAVGRKSSCTADGINWTETGSYPGDSENGRIEVLSEVAYGGGKFVAFESSYPSGNLGAYTVDCNSWSLIVFPESANWKHIAYGSGKFVLLGSSGETIYSTDAIAWSVGPIVPITSPNALKYCNGKFYVLPSDKTKNAYCSEDGVSWSVANIPNDCAWISMAYGGGKYILISKYDGSSQTKFAVSEDGENWVVDAIGINGTDDNGLAYGDNKFVCFEAYGKRFAYTQSGYGGTISYQYQYSIDGGTTWTAAGPATTDTEKTITVPQDAEQFMVRVRAQDDMGFVSDDYVAGENLMVQVMMLWVGVNGVARLARKASVGVNGAARPVVRGWVGDENGVARRWF